MPEGYESGPDAPVRAALHALARADGAATLVLVEGISDQIAVETAAQVRGLDLDAEGVVVVPVGGAHAVGRVLRTLAPGRPSAARAVRVVGLCDRREEGVVGRALEAAGLGAVRDRPDLERLGFFVCDEDLEDELVRAVGAHEALPLLAAEGDLRAFRSLQDQPAWRGRAADEQLRRFLGSGGSRKLRYARLLVVAAAERDRLPLPLVALLEAVG
ncbi:hypothetical protein N868_05545 [Cellulomonas carbonis T26]|uniref:OLD protein-like TOPRIM domain-containing protein n=1 Tax=Cellulomonas carbonis T26 TaxID=947969 RepID=A0A0A0BUI0_9CELL|nr:hypothetical protein N868_05545 [Cellulomonas carbonis T26]